MNRLLQFVSDNVLIIWVALVVLFTAVGLWNEFYGPVVSGYAHVSFRP